jgi:shikimate kinase
MNRPDNVFLIGPMGAGKSSVGKQLARQLGMQYLDSDREIEQRTGADIPLIFELEGEQGFRERESRVIAELTQGTNIVLSTGGGAVLREDNRHHLSSRGIVIYLRASIDEILQRTAKDKNRPLLQTADPAARLRDLMQERGPLYDALADITIDTDGCSVREVVKNIVRQLAETADKA